MRAAKAAGFRARVTDAEAFARENLVLLLEHTATKVPLDLSLALQPFESDAAQHPVTRWLGKTAVPVASLTALLIYKMVASRPKDLEDVRALVSTGEPFDVASVEHTLTEFDGLLETNRADEFRRLIRR